MTQPERIRAALEALPAEVIDGLRQGARAQASSYPQVQDVVAAIAQLRRVADELESGVLVMACEMRRQGGGLGAPGALHVEFYERRRLLLTLDGPAPDFEPEDESDEGQPRERTVAERLDGVVRREWG